MPPKKGKKKKVARRGAGGGGEGPSPNTIVYRGPIDTMQSRNRAPATFTVPITDYLKASVTLSSNTAFYNHVFAGVDVLSSFSYTDYSAAWQELRILGMKVRFIPQNFIQANSSPAATPIDPSPHILAPYRGNATAFTSLSQAVVHKPAKIACWVDYLTAEIKMDEADEASFVSTQGGTVPAVMGIKSALNLTYSGSASAVVIFGYYIITWLVQFRGLVDGNTQVKTILSREPQRAVAADGRVPRVSDAEERKDPQDVLSGVEDLGYVQLSVSDWKAMRAAAAKEQAVSLAPTGGGGTTPARFSAK